jgi:hypothetical protein
MVSEEKIFFQMDKKNANVWTYIGKNPSNH